MNSVNYILIDTTLRDGEQTAGIVFSNEEKLDMAKVMNEIGIPIIEAGIPASGIEERELLKEMINLKLKSKLISWNRANTGDIDASVECGFSSVHISVPVSDIHINFKLKKNREWVIEKLSEVLDYAKSFGLEVSVGAEDSSRADMDFFLKVAETAYSFGAVRIRYADTIGGMNPFSVMSDIGYISKRCPLPIDFHGHNDFGLATANSLSAILAGVEYISCASTGIGERAGNTCLEEFVAAAIQTTEWKPDLLTEAIPKLTSIVEKASGKKYSYKNGRKLPHIA